jgi:valyl-tRNA synthetase
MVKYNQVYLTRLPMEKAYEAKKVEDKIYETWERSGFFNPDKLPGRRRESFTIVLPPPNATGQLHIGHAMMLAIEDLMIRYQRMQGKKTLWLPGTDHAAIATNAIVERELAKEGKTKSDLGRDQYVARVKDYIAKSQNTIRNQIKKMGSSLDWSREAYTWDEPRNLAVNTVFKMMYDDGLIYRGYRIVNWCPHCQSTLADDEVEYQEENGKFYWIKYGPFVLATARPETKLGDTAVAVHPNDKRYKKMVGKKYMIPGVLGEFEITVVADKAVDPKFGTGAVKVTPAHSFVDYEIAERHGVAVKQIIDENGRMMANCGKYAGMTTREAREAIVADMQKMGLIDHVEENYQHNVSTCYRCKNIVEPLPSRQWFINVNSKFQIPNSKIKGIKSGDKVSLKQLMQQVVKNGQIKIIPERFERVYFHWINNLRDWCISRQIWVGHQIPVWYRKQSGVQSPESRVEITYFVHSSSTDNVKKIASGHNNVSLSSRGIEQSKAVAKQIKASDYDVIFSSDLKRAKESAEYFFGKGNFKIDKRLREIDYGKLNGQPVAEVGPLKSKMVDQPFPGGESYREVEKRVGDFLREVSQKYPGKKIAILSHQAPQLALEVLLKNKTWPQAFKEDWRNIPNNWQPGWQYELPAGLKMGFAERVVPQVLAGKTKTYRTRDHQFKAGDQVDFENSQTGEIFGQGKIVKVEETTVDKINLQDQAHGATYNKVEELIAAFRRHHPEQRVDEKTKVWIYTYKFISPDVSQEIYVGVEPPKGDGWERDSDTLDTWFSSGLWTFSTLGWPKKTADLKTYHPTDVLETMFDILFFWVARMIMMSTYVLGEIPFKTVYLHARVLDKDGEKMSKSKPETMIDPLEVCQEFGTDAVRLSLLLGIAPGSDVRLSKEKIAGFRNFTNKLWNISRYILEKSRVQSPESRAGNKRKINYSGLRTQGSGLSLADRWILSRLQETIESVTKDLENYDLSGAGEDLRAFTWNELADWYLESSKIGNQKPEIGNQVLIYVLETVLKLWQPFMPFVTEEIWSHQLGHKELLLVQAWPQADKKLIDHQAVKDFQIIQEIIGAIRNLRAENKVEPSKRVKIVFKAGRQEKLIKMESEVIKFLARLGEIEFLAQGKVGQAATAVVAGVEIYLPLAGLIDFEQEKKKLGREIESLQKYYDGLKSRLANSDFVGRAPQAVVTGEKVKLAEAKEKLEKLKKQLESLE